MDAVIIMTGIANVASLIAGFERIGVAAVVSGSAADVRDAKRIILPGVGAFAAGMQELTQQGLVEALCERIVAGRPTLAVCLGLHLLCKSSEESPGVSGLGIIDAEVKRFDHAKVPQLGWNRVVPESDMQFVTEGYAYFANSFHLPSDVPGWQVARTDYGAPFVSAIENEAILGCQFHPELSGKWGLSVLKRWVSHSEQAC